MQSYAGGLERLSVDNIAPILRRGVLLDVAGRQGVEALPCDFEIMPEELEAVEYEQKVEVQPGDTVAFELAPDPDMPVHVHPLVETGIHMVELAIAAREARG